MLGRKSKSNQESRSSVPHVADQNQSLNCVVAKGTTIDGNIHCQDHVRLDGMLKGDLKSTAQVVLGLTGEIQGDMIAAIARIEGKITGNLVISELLILGKTAVVEGTINATKLQIEEGATFRGTSKVGAPRK